MSSHIVRDSTHSHISNVSTLVEFRPPPPRHRPPFGSVPTGSLRLPHHVRASLLTSFTRDWVANQRPPPRGTNAKQKKESGVRIKAPQGGGEHKGRGPKWMSALKGPNKRQEKSRVRIKFHSRRRRTRDPRRRLFSFLCFWDS